MTITRIERLKNQPDHARAPLWLIGMTDLVTLLLAFFILLFSTTQPRTPQLQAASDALRARFAGEVSKTKIKDEKKSWEAEIKDPGLNLDYLHSVVKNYLAEDENLSNVTLWQNDDSVILSFGTDLGFYPGKSALSERGKTVLNKLSVLLQRLPNTVEVIGHADNTAIQNDENFNSNWQLSLLRANATAIELKNDGYDSTILIRGRGSMDAGLLPEALAEETRNALSRRVDIRLHQVRP